MNLTSSESVSAFVRERYDIGITADHAWEIYFALATSRYPDVTLKQELQRLGYLTPLFAGREDDSKWVWNELHLFASSSPEPNDFAVNDESGYLNPPPAKTYPNNIGPSYARSKLSRTQARVKPINKTAHSVAPPPTDDQW